MPVCEGVPSQPEKRGAPRRYLVGVEQLITELARLTRCSDERLVCALEEALFSPKMPSGSGLRSKIRAGSFTRTDRPQPGGYCAVHLVATRRSETWLGRLGSAPDHDTHVAMCWEPCSQSLQVRVPSSRYRKLPLASFTARFAVDRYSQLRSWYGEQFASIVLLVVGPTTQSLRLAEEQLRAEILARLEERKLQASLTFEEYLQLEQPCVDVTQFFASGVTRRGVADLANNWNCPRARLWRSPWQKRDVLTEEPRSPTPAERLALERNARMADVVASLRYRRDGSTA